MAEPVTLFRDDEQITVHAPSEVRRLVAAGWGFSDEVGADADPVGAELNRVRRWVEADDDEAAPAWHEFDGLALGDRVVEALVDAGIPPGAVQRHAHTHDDGAHVHVHGAEHPHGHVPGERR